LPDFPKAIQVAPDKAKHLPNALERDWMALSPEFMVRWFREPFAAKCDEPPNSPAHINLATFPDCTRSAVQAQGIPFPVTAPFTLSPSIASGDARALVTGNSSTPTE
jgi:hypothetical protein